MDYDEKIKEMEDHIYKLETEIQQAKYRLKQFIAASSKERNKKNNILIKDKNVDIGETYTISFIQLFIFYSMKMVYEKGILNRILNR